MMKHMSVNEVMTMPTLAIVLLIPALVAAFLFVRLCGRLAGLVGDGSSNRKWLSALTVLLALIVIAFVMLLNFRGDQAIARINRTNAFHRVITMGLEQYRSEYGEYPSPAKQGVHIVLDGHDYEASGALMLYQALTGDGNDKLKVANATSASDGKVTGDEVGRAFVMEMPAEMWRKTEVGWMLVDGFGHPFQYTTGGPDRVNASYDLWSFGEADPVAKVDKTAKQGAEAEKWIKNW